VPNLVGDRSEGGARRWGSSGSYRRRLRRGVLQARMPEGGGEGVEELLRVGVVLLVPMAGVRELCNGGATTRPDGRRNSSSSALRSGSSGGGNGNWLT
jgi:hypothetical protein